MDIRKRKDRAFMTTQVEIVEVEKQCQAEVEHWKAELDEANAVAGNRIRWLSDELRSTRQKNWELHREIQEVEEARASMMMEYQAAREMLGGDNDRLRGTFTWAQWCYHEEMEKNVQLTTVLELAEATRSGLMVQMSMPRPMPLVCRTCYP